MAWRGLLESWPWLISQVPINFYHRTIPRYIMAQFCNATGLAGDRGKKTPIIVFSADAIMKSVHQYLYPHAS